MKLLFVIGVTLLLQTPRPASPDGLRFNWPKDLTARVETEKTRERQTGATTTSTTVRASYRLRTLPHAKGLEVHYDEFKFDGVPAQAGASEIFATMIPNLIVDASGTFLGVTDIASLKTHLTTLLAPLQKKENEMPAGVKDLMSRHIQRLESLRPM